MKKQYKVGEFAQNLGVSTGFLKHHEHYGLLKPHISKSGYRYYDFSQSMQAVQCLRLQGLGFTAKEIAEILTNSTDIDFPALVTEKSELIRKNLVLYDEILQYLDHNGKGFEKQSESGSNWDDWSIVTPEPFYYLENASEGEFKYNKEYDEIITNWNNYAPLMEITHRARPDENKNVTISPAELSFHHWAMGPSIRKHSADRIGVKLNQHVKCVIPGKCLVYQYAGYKQNFHGHDFVRQTLKKPLSICEQHNFPVCDDIYIFKIFASTASDVNYSHERILVPLEPMRIINF